MYRHYSILNWRRTSQTHLNYKSHMRRWLKYDFYFILDFESTCDRKSKLANQEIIEFPCLWADSNFQVLSHFHQYVKPIYNPILTPFCIELTGIMQTMVDEEKTFDKVLVDFLCWLQNIEKSVGNNKKTTFVTCGDWDLQTMLPNQCQLSNLVVPRSMTQWLNLKKVFMEETLYYPKSLKDMCQHLDLQLVGREHSGIDDCCNILRIMKALKMRTF